MAISFSRVWCYLLSYLEFSYYLFFQFCFLLHFHLIRLNRYLRCIGDGIDSSVLMRKSWSAFVPLKTKLFTSDHVFKCSTSFSIMLAQSGVSLTLHLLYREVSSGNWKHVLNVNVDLMTYLMSVTYKLKSVGPKIRLWGTPHICVTWYTLWKKRLWHRWFPVYSAKVLRTPAGICCYIIKEIQIVYFLVSHTISRSM